jgi:hypothetical protein
MGKQLALGTGVTVGATVLMGGAAQAATLTVGTTDDTSGAVDAGSAFGLTTDQRGLGRPFDAVTANAAGGDAADIGAVELQVSDLPAAPTTTPTTPTTPATPVSKKKKCKKKKTKL